MSAAQPAAVDKDRCAQEPIHIPGSIQPHGIMLVLAEHDLQITNVSLNIEGLLGIPAATACGARLSLIFGRFQAERLEQAVRRGDPIAMINPMRFTLEVGGVPIDFECVLHRSGGMIILELEPYKISMLPHGLDLFAHVRTPIARMEAAPDIEALVRGAADDVRAICGFDRVMIYRFDEDWNGDVLAESTGAAPVAYLGLHFPAGDIPVQARSLYLRNALRLIADVDYTPALLFPQHNPATGDPLDLSRAILRSVSPVHIEYLHNLNVRSTLTISIVVGGALWGLIACHHLQPRRVDYVTRASCEFFGQMLAWQLGSRLISSGLQDKIRSGGLIGSYDRSLNAHGELIDGMLAEPQLVLDLFAAHGLVLRIDDTLHRYAAAPEDDRDVAAIVASLHERLADGVAATHQVNADALVASGASGAILMTLSELGDEYLLVLREETIKSVDWAGDTREPLTESDGRLHPRTSFALWSETVRGQSRRWSNDDLASAHALRERILERSHVIERHRAEERLSFLAHHDSLTLLPNRSSFNDTLQRAIRHAKRDGSMLAVLFIDLDHFKVYNDEFGHAVGDLILQTAGTRMKDCVRHDDVVARLGGDEFVIISTKIAAEADGDAVARKVLAAIARPFAVASGQEIRVTASIGIAVFPRDAPDADALLQHADLAMYRAKEQGRNSFARFDVGDAGPSYERLALERRIEAGFEHGEFVAYYQPIVSLHSGRIVSFEALARWNHPDRGVLAPIHFIAVAEESRLIVTLGEVMLRDACFEVARWRTLPGCENLRVSVNVSARQFRDPAFLETVLGAVSQSGIASAALQLELTESILIENEEYAMRTLRALAAAGVSMSIDDFGTGYSSLSYLKRLPVDVLKIDQSFIREVTSSSDDSAIVRAIIAMAHSLKLRVIAEGVETREQLEYLRAEGCDSVQGYFIARPLPPVEATAFIVNFELERAIIR